MSRLLSAVAFLSTLLALSLVPTACQKHEPPPDPNAELIAQVCGEELVPGGEVRRQVERFMEAYEIDCDHRTATPRSKDAEYLYLHGEGVQP